jgi:hypothetical protein
LGFSIGWAGLLIVAGSRAEPPHPQRTGKLAAAELGKFPNDEWKFPSIHDDRETQSL